MSSPTKIIVLKQKKLIYGAVIALVLLAILLFFICSTPGKTKPYNTPDSPVQYTAGVYSSTVILNGNPVEIKVTIDENLIHHIGTSNVSDSIETMYPLFGSCFDDIATQVVANNSTLNVTYNSENKYTSIVLLEAIDKAIEKSVKIK